MYSIYTSCPPFRSIKSLSHPVAVAPFLENGHDVHNKQTIGTCKHPPRREIHVTGFGGDPNGKKTRPTGRGLVWENGLMVVYHSSSQIIIIHQPRFP